MPIPVSGNHFIISNYRSISVQSYTTKVFETLVFNFIQQLLNKFIMEEQHGFCPGRLTTNYNLVFSNFVYESFKLGP